MSSTGPASVDERIADWVDDRMTPRERDRFEAELRVNPRLRAEAEGYQRLVQQLRAVGQGATDAIDVSARVLAALQKPEQPRSPIRASGPSRPALIASSVVAAAALVLVSVLSQWQPAVTLRSEGSQPAVADKAPLAPAPANSKAAAPDEGAGLAAVRAGLAAAPQPDPSRESQLGPPSSVVPQITLAQAPRKTGAAAVPTGGGSGAPAASGPIADARVGGGGGGAGAEFADRAASAADFAWQALALGLQIERLTGVPMPAGKADADGEATKAPAAYLVQGTKAEMDAFLRRLAEVSRARGLEVRNSEADARSVAAMVPAAPAAAGDADAAPGAAAKSRKAADETSETEPKVRLVVVVPAVSK